MIEHLTYLWEFSFIKNAVFSGLMIALICPLIGVFLVVRRMSLIADTLSHVALSGVAAGILLQKTVPALTFIQPVYVGMGFSAVASFLIERLRNIYPFYRELSLPIVLAAATGMSVVFISLADGFNGDLFGYLFGSLITVSRIDLLIIFIIGLIVVAAILLLYKEWFLLSFEEEGAFVSGIPAQILNRLFIILTALVIMAAMNIVGILLVSALITLPVAAALQVARSFKQMFGYAILFAQLSTHLGLLISYFYALSTGGTIVVIAAAILLLMMGLKRMRQRTGGAA